MLTLGASYNIQLCISRLTGTVEVHKECVAVSTFSLATLVVQVHAFLNHGNLCEVDQE